MTSPETLKCATHPDVETNLRCGRCCKPICPRCLVQTPVGARCRDCAKVSKLPTYNMAPAYYLRAAGAALGIAVVIGLAWGYVISLFSFVYLNLIIAGGIGYAIGEVTSLAVNRKRGTWLAVVGSVAVVICYLVGIFTFGDVPRVGLGLVLDIAGLVIGISGAVARLR